MKFRSLVAAAAVAVVGSLLAAVPASAQATRTWISGVGDDVNPCSRTAPCKTFPGAISKTAAGGEIDTLDPGGFGAVTVTKAMTLANEGIGEAGILVAGTNGITVNCATDPNCVVVVRGLIIDGGPIGSNSLNGIRFIAGKALMVQNTAIRNFTGGSPNGWGISFQPSASQPEQLDVTDTTITTNGQAGGGVGGGILVQPGGTANVSVNLTRVNVFNNDGSGLKADGSQASGGAIKVSVADSIFGGNSGGIAAISGAGGTGASVAINVDGSTVSNNTVGVATNSGANVSVTLGRSQVTGNAVGVIAAGGSHVYSYGDNAIHDNTTTNGTPTAATRL